MAQAEWVARVDLAAAYRLAALNGWDDTIHTHISATVPGEPDAYLINPFGLLFDEVCASNLVKVSVRGDKLDDSPHPVTTLAPGQPDRFCHPRRGTRGAPRCRLCAASAYPLGHGLVHAARWPASHQPGRDALARTPRAPRV